MIPPLRLYGEGLMLASDPTYTDGEMCLRLRDGSIVPLPLGRYLKRADATEQHLLLDVRGPVLDVGCGPGRHLHVLASLGEFALGVDLSPVAVEFATGRGGHAIVGSIFDELPGTGSWRSALLLDGNIGIGGRPDRLLRRIGTLLRGDGELLVELDDPRTQTGSTLARIESDRGVSSWFPWAQVSVCDLEPVARAGGFRAGWRRSLGGRWFASLRLG
jgi:SAM-dependent methyltransferase